MTPAAVDQCSLWQFNAAVAGWIRANTTEDDRQMTPEEEDDLWQGIIART